MRASSSQTPYGAAAQFSNTHWSIVLRAGQPASGAAEEALAQLCQRYWYPLYSHVRGRGYPPEEAQDLTQDFFARFLEKNCVRQVDRQRGRFRDFLRSSVDNFLANDWAKRRTVKRGGHCRFVSWDELQAEERYAQEPIQDMTPEKLFDRRWATTLLENAMEALRREHQAQEDWALFEALREHLSGGEGGENYRQLAARFGLTEAAVKMRVRRLRRRFGELLRAEVAQTVTDPAKLEEEMQYLLTLWG